MAVGLTAAARAEGPFVKLPFDKALAKAGTEKKMVFVDFYATWCMPCKMLDATTFKDPKVVELLTSKFVALTIDAEANQKLAKQYHVTAFPTLIFLKPDGSVAEVLAGYVDAQAFLGLAQAVLAGKDSLTRYRRALQRTPNDPLLHAMIAEALSARGKSQEALDHCKFVIEKPDLDVDSAALMPAIVGQLMSMAQSSPEAATYLDEQTQAAGKAVLAQQATNAQIALLATMHQFKRDEAGLLRTYYDKLLQDHANPAFLSRVTALWLGPLMTAERYEDIAKHLDVAQEAERISARLTPPKPATEGQAALGPRQPEDFARQTAIVNALTYYKVLLALNEFGKANALAVRLEKADDSPQLLNALAWSAYEVNKVTPVNLDQVRRANQLLGGKDASVIDTLARVLDRLGKKDQAVKTVREALTWAAPGFEQSMLQECLKDIQAKPAKRVPTQPMP